MIGGKMSPSIFHKSEYEKKREEVKEVPPTDKHSIDQEIFSLNNLWLIFSVAGLFFGIYMVIFFWWVGDFDRFEIAGWVVISVSAIGFIWFWCRMKSEK